jgi:signal transduction histidine kinase
MMPAAERDTFDALHPFSFITDEYGTIHKVGRSLAKILPQVTTGQIYTEVFSFVKTQTRRTTDNPRELVGELLVLTTPLHERVKLRGQVAPWVGSPNQFLFAMEISISSPSDISALDLSITDFRIADPIFDFLLFMQGQILNQQRLREAKASLEWKNHITNHLLSIALSTQRSDNEEATYRSTLNAVCQSFDWDVGHVLLLSGDDPSALISSGIWNMNDCHRFAAFHQDTNTWNFRRGEGLPGRVLDKKDVVWLRDVSLEANFHRRAGLEGLGPVTAVGVPVFVGESVVAVVEFFKENASFEAAQLIRFFELLSIQLSAVVARQRAEVDSRRHIAALANASKMATLGEIVAGVAHEINNPLHTLTLTSHLLQRLSNDGRLSKETLQNQLDKVDTCVQRMATIVSELKAFSRDSTHDQYKRTSLRTLVDETLDLCHARLLSKDIRVHVSDIPDSWGIECRPSQISQVMLNLLNNAFDATLDHAERWIHLDIRDKGTFFEIAVTDSGNGVPKEVARKIMDPFFTTKPPGKGTGLGLSISSNIMIDHGGSLTLDQTSPHTRFVMTVPKVQGQVGRTCVAIGE